MALCRDVTDASLSKHALSWLLSLHPVTGTVGQTIHRSVNNLFCPENPFTFLHVSPFRDFPWELFLLSAPEVDLSFTVSERWAMDSWLPRSGGAAGKKYHRLGGLDTRNGVSHSSGASHNLPPSWFLLGPLSLACRRLSSLSVVTWPSLSARVYLHSSLLFLEGRQSYWIRAQPNHLIWT